MANRITWEQRIRRAEKLLERNSSSAELLAFYGQLLVFQQQMGQSIKTHASFAPAEGTSLLEQLDISVAMQWLPALLDLVEKQGPAKLAEQARRVRNVGATEQRQILVAFLGDGQPASYGPSSFLARVLFQTQAESLASGRIMPANYSGATCPLCGGRPQFAVLRPEGDGGKRHLGCSLCLAEWEFRRIVCPVCDEVDYTKLPRYSVDEPMAVRVEACDTCKSYLKSFDMTVDGLMVPDVDEIATVALDFWAGEQDYQKTQLNLLGF